MKNRTSNFKNPFDLMQQQQDPIVLNPSSYEYKSQQRSNYNPSPFNPYQISPSQNPVTISMKKKPDNNKNSVSPSSGNLSQFNPYNPHQQDNFKQPNISTFTNVNNDSQQSSRQFQLTRSSQLNQDGDPPLLQDIGIQPQKIKQRILSVIKLAKPDNEMMEDPDLSGPILIALCFGCLLLLAGKVHFGDIYAIFIFGNLLLYVFFNFMTQGQRIAFYNIMSTMGYGLLPMCLLGVLGIFISLKGMAGVIFGLALAGWCSFAAGNIMQALMKQRYQNRKLLIVYPIFLFYMSFAMIVMF